MTRYQMDYGADSVLLYMYGALLGTPSLFTSAIAPYCWLIAREIVPYDAVIVYSNALFERYRLTDTSTYVCVTG